MRKLILLLILCAYEVSNAETVIEYKNWKTYKNLNGFEFKYPSCWKLEHSQYDATGPIDQSQDVFIGEDGECKSRKRARNVPNGVSVSIVNNLYKKKSDMNADVERNKKWIKRVNENRRPEYELIVKDFEENENYWYIEVDGGSKDSQIRWQMYLYCYPNYIQVTGPTISNPDQSYYQKFKEGDLAIPEPEKTIIESIKCIEPSKSKQNNSSEKKPTDKKNMQKNKSSKNK